MKMNIVHMSTATLFSDLDALAHILDYRFDDFNSIYDPDDFDFELAIVFGLLT